MIESVKADLVPDPHNVPVTFSNLFLSGGAMNGVINFNLGVLRFGPTMDGKIDNDPIVTNRIRIDLQVAIALRDFLNAQIALLTVSDEKAN